jgi:hypothetical protein
MSANRDEILQAALELPEADRFIIANRLLSTLPEDFPGLADDAPDFIEELERRSGDWEGAIPWEELRNDLRRSS